MIDYPAQHGVIIYGSRKSGHLQTPDSSFSGPCHVGGRRRFRWSRSFPEEPAFPRRAEEDARRHRQAQCAGHRGPPQDQVAGEDRQPERPALWPDLVIIQPGRDKDQQDQETGNSQGKPVQKKGEPVAPDAFDHHDIGLRGKALGWAGESGVRRGAAGEHEG
jgi:hypothetical protein